jgi:hypothetical protein
MVRADAFADGRQCGDPVLYPLLGSVQLVVAS